MSDEAEYRNALIENGIGIHVESGVIAKLCRRLLSSAKKGLSGDDVNLVAAFAPEVAWVVSKGVMRVDDDSAILVLPPVRETLNLVRDALWFEADSATRHWAKGTRAILRHLREATEGTALELGPRSPICHQDKSFAAGPPGAIFSASGSTREEAGYADHEHDDWMRVRVPVSNNAVPSPSFMTFDMCAVCGKTSGATMRLGLVILGPVKPHEHRWSKFVTPVPDSKGIMGRMTGEVCMVEVGPGLRPGRCLATKGVRLLSTRKLSLPRLPEWVNKSGSILRPVLKFDRRHKHLWEPGRVALGGGASLEIVRCVLCDAEYWSNTIHGESVPELMRELRRRVKAVGGFAKAPTEDLLEIRAEMRPKWGPYLGWFGDALAMIVCKSGELREATEEERERAASYAERAKEIAREEHQRALDDFHRGRTA